MQRGIKIEKKRNKKDKQEIAKKLKLRNFSIQEIIEITGLTKQDLKNI